MRAAALAMLLAPAFAAAAPGDVVPQGEPRPDRPLRDPDFNVGSERIGLERQVLMYQWRLDDDGYTKVWNDAPIDSSRFDAAHRNPDRLPVRNRQWWAERIMLDGYPLPVETARLIGQWTVLRPNFSRLPGNLTATFQPEGDGLGSSFNPLAPEIGDVRITWREFVLPPLAGKLQLHDGVWRLTPVAAAAPAAVRPAVDIAAATREPARHLRPWLVAVAAICLVGLWWLARLLTGGKRR